MKNQDQLQLPFTQTIKWMSWLSIVTAPFLTGFIFGLIALYLSDKDNRLHQSFPNNYPETTLQALKKQKQLAVLGAFFSSIFLIIILSCFFFFGTVNPFKISQLVN